MRFVWELSKLYYQHRKPLATVSMKCLPDTGTEKSINNTTMGWYNPLLAIYMITEWFRLNRYQALFRLILDFSVVISK